MDNVQNIATLKNDILGRYLHSAEARAENSEPQGIRGLFPVVDDSHPMECNSSIEQYLAKNSGSRKSGQGVLLDCLESFKKLGQSGESLFRSTPSNLFSSSSNCGISPIVATPAEAMKITSGFNTKIQKGSPNSSGSAFSPPLKGDTGSAFSQIVAKEKTASALFAQFHHPSFTVSEPIPVIHEEPSNIMQGEYEESEEDSPKKETKKRRKKAKKERNRLSAQECRKRKKQYVESLEQKVKQLTTELEDCKIQLEEMKKKEKDRLAEEYHNSGEFKTQREELLNEIKNAIFSKQSSKELQDWLTKLNDFSGIGSAKRLEIIKFLTEEFINTLFPTPCKYLLWSASTSSSLFDNTTETKRLKKNQKYLLYEAKEKTQQNWRDIWAIIEDATWKKNSLQELRPHMANFLKQKFNLF